MLLDPEPHDHLDLDNLISRKIEYYYVPGEGDEVNCEPHALGIIFKSYLQLDGGPYPLELWLTEPDVVAVAFDEMNSRN